MRIVHRSTKEKKTQIARTRVANRVYNSVHDRVGVLFLFRGSAFAVIPPPPAVAAHLAILISYWSRWSDARNSLVCLAALMVQWLFPVKFADRSTHFVSSMKWDIYLPVWVGHVFVRRRSTKLVGWLWGRNCCPSRSDTWHGQRYNLIYG